MRVFLLPGFLLDSRAFGRLRLQDPPFRPVDYIPLARGDTLASYARRMADHMGFKSGDVVGGLSLGGMLGLEMARARGASKVLLMASASHSRFVRAPFRTLARLAPIIPARPAKACYPLVVFALKRKALLAPESENLLYDMVRRFPDSLFKRLPSLVMRWKGCADPGCPVARLHSENDWLIRPAPAGPHSELIPGRNHLITLSHPDAVRRFIYRESGAAVPGTEEALRT